MSALTAGTIRLTEARLRRSRRDWLWVCRRTRRLDVPQAEVTIGVPELRDPAELELPELLRMPFGPQRPPWRLPDGTRPVRPLRPGERWTLRA